MPLLLSGWIPCILFAAVIVIGIPLWCWFADDNEPRSSEPDEAGPEHLPDLDVRDDGPGLVLMVV